MHIPVSTKLFVSSRSRSDDARFFLLFSLLIGATDAASSSSKPVIKSIDLGLLQRYETKTISRTKSERMLCSNCVNNYL